MHTLHLGEFTVVPATGEMVGPAGRQQLDPKVIQVLLVLVRHAGEVVTRQELLEQVWPGVVVGDDVISRCIYQLRLHLRKAGGDSRHAALVETLPKRGYRLNCTAHPVAPSHAPTLPTPKAESRSVWPYIAGIAALLIAVTTAGWHLWRTDAFWQDPLDNARYTRVTDFEGVAPSVALSRDGNQLAFVASRNGTLDAWITQAGTGEFRNLTQGRVSGMDTPVRSLSFTPDGAHVAVWTRSGDSPATQTVHTWMVRATGGTPQPFLQNVAEVDWTSDGTRMVYHPAAPGDPLFVADAHKKADRQIYIAPNGVHCHFPVWSPDGRFIYFVRGVPPDDMDIWRIASGGGEPERVTFHATRVSHPVFLDATTLLYLATTEDGSGPRLHGLNITRGVAHRIGPALDQYTSLAASADGRRLIATRATPKTSLWRVPVMARVASEADARAISLPAARGRSPRLGQGYVLLVSPSDGSGIRKLNTADNRLTELWNDKQTRVVAGPAIDPISQRIAFSVAEEGTTRLKLMNADGTGLRTLASKLEVRGVPAWWPDGKSILVAAGEGQDTRLFQVPLDGAEAAPFAADYSRDAAWSPDGRFFVFNATDVGPTFLVKALSADGRPRTLPNLLLPRGARRLVFMPGENALIVLRGGAHDRNFWLVNLDTGHERKLTEFDTGFAIGDFDVSEDGREIVFDQLRDEAEVFQIDLAGR